MTAEGTGGEKDREAPGLSAIIKRVSTLEVSKVTTAVIHDGDTEESYICADSEVAWRKVANQMMEWLPRMIADWGPQERELADFKEMIEKHEYSDAAGLWDEMTNGEQHFEVDSSSVLLEEKEPVWPAGLEI